MAIDYSELLSKEQKEQLLKGRRDQFAADYFQNKLNLEASTRLGDTASADQAQRNMDTLAVAIELHQEELDKLVPATSDVVVDAPVAEIPQV